MKLTNRPLARPIPEPSFLCTCVLRSFALCEAVGICLGTERVCRAGALAENQALASKLEGAALPEDGFHAVARLAWGLLLAQHAPPTARGVPRLRPSAIEHGRETCVGVRGGGALR